LLGGIHFQLEHEQKKLDGVSRTISFLHEFNNIALNNNIN